MNEMLEAPVIGITISVDHGQRIRPGHDYLYVKRAYTQAVSRAGGHPILISPDLDVDAVNRICDGVIISGGDDIPPELYGEQADSVILAESVERIEWERRVLDLCSRIEKPVFGVCYGMQLINVHFGGSLHQDVASATDCALDHGGRGKVMHHALKIKEGSFLFPLFGGETEVCSTHCQAVKRVAPDFSVAAVSEDGFIEAIERGNTIAVEWHPESDRTGELLYSLFIERARQSKSR
jgi:putative glutamine amidotransferase